MTISLKHAFQSAVADGGDTSIVRPSNWNAEHTLTLAENTLLGRASAGTGAAEEVACTAAGRALLDDADAAAQRTTLGLVIGTNVQAYDGGLADLAGLTPTDGNIIVGDGTNWIVESGSTARASLGLAIGTNVQAWDAQLDSLSSASANGASLVTAADYAAMKALLDLEIGTDLQAYDADTAKTDVAQAWTAQQYVTLATLTDGANISWNVATGQKAKVTLAGNRTMDAVSNAVEGATYTLWAIQDGTGSRTITWTTTGTGSFDFGTDGAPTLTTTASKADLLAFEAISIGGTLKLRFAGIKKGFG